MLLPLRRVFVALVVGAAKPACEYMSATKSATNVTNSEDEHASVLTKRDGEVTWCKLGTGVGVCRLYVASRYDLGAW